MWPKIQCSVGASHLHHAASSAFSTQCRSCSSCVTHQASRNRLTFQKPLCRALRSSFSLTSPSSYWCCISLCRHSLVGSSVIGCRQFLNNNSALGRATPALQLRF